MTDISAPKKPPAILLVEDNPDDVDLLRHGFMREKFKVELTHVENGEECMHALRKQGKYSELRRPDLILLDLNLPVMDGREVLAEIVRDEGLRSLPVVVLTTSVDERDVMHMYKLRCSSYLNKPVDFDEFQLVIQQIKNYWFSLAILPSRFGTAA